MRTLTFTMEDALISPEGIMILSGAGLIDAGAAKKTADGEVIEDIIYVHTTSQVEVTEDKYIELPKMACWSHSGEAVSTNYSDPAPAEAEDTLADLFESNTKSKKITHEYYHANADIFIFALDNGEVETEPCIPAESGVRFINRGTKEKPEIHTLIKCVEAKPGRICLIDYYVKRTTGVKQIEITPDKFGGYYYLEASTLFRDNASGVDMPAEFIIPKCKVQSNFTFTMAGSGDPSTFTFTLDAFPDYTKFDGTKKVLAAIQVVTDEDEGDDESGDERRHHCKPDESGSGDSDKDTFSHYSTYAETGKWDGFKKPYNEEDPEYIYLHGDDDQQP